VLKQSSFNDFLTLNWMISITYFDKVEAITKQKLTVFAQN